jgi:hypothetical protein
MSGVASCCISGLTEAILPSSNLASALALVSLLKVSRCLSPAL